MATLATLRQSDISIFRRSLWKDQRDMQLIEEAGGLVLLKRSVYPNEFRTEAAVLGALRAAGCRVPEVRETSDSGILLEYEKGVRLFNLLVHIDELQGELGGYAQALKAFLVDRGLSQEKKIQSVLATLTGIEGVGIAVYPISEKCGTLLELLTKVLQITYNQADFKRELATLEEEWASYSVIPFRDATPKNIMLSDQRLWLGCFEGDERRRQDYILSSCQEAYPSFPEWARSPIVDYDFGSCVDLTTPEDDPLSFLCHERTFEWSKVSATELTWLNHDLNIRRLSLAFFLRYLRFGGRKAAYRLIHPRGHVTRFRQDNDRFYFDTLEPVLSFLDSDLRADYPLLFEIWDGIRRGLVSANVLHDQVMREGYATEQRVYYVDIYPY